jgi:sensor histidine kinase YesM
MSKKNGFFISAIVVMTTLFSPNGFADTTPAMQRSSSSTIHDIDEQISELEAEKQTYDTQARRIGVDASRLQFEDFLLSRQMYSHQRRLQYKSEAIEEQIQELKKKKAAMKKGS